MDRRGTEMRTRAGAVRTGGLSTVKLNLCRTGTILGLCILASACAATSRGYSLEHMIFQGLGPMAALRVLRVEKLAGRQMALVRVERPLNLTTEGALIAFPTHQISGESSAPTRTQPGDRLWLVGGRDCSIGVSAGAHTPGPETTPGAVLRRWGPRVALFDAAAQPVRRFAGTEWVLEPAFGLPESIRTRTQGKRTWFHFGDIERYIRQGLIEDTTLVRFVEDSCILAVGTMHESTRRGWGALSIERVLAVRDAAVAPAMGEELQFEEHWSWLNDVGYGKPMLWFLKRPSNGFCFASLETTEKVLKIIRRRKGWIEMKSLEHVAPTPRRRLATPYVMFCVLAAVLVLAGVTLLRIVGARPVEQSA